MLIKKASTENWKEVKIKDFGVVLTGNTPSTKNKDYYGGSYKLISPADLTDSKYIFTAHKFITEKGLGVARTVPRNSVLVGCIGNIGKIGITTDKISAFNQQINAIACNEKFDADFVYYILQYQKPLLESKSAKVTLPILNKNNFENIELEVPELSEQKSIAYVLNSVQNVISSQEELIAKLKELKQSAMQHLLTHGTKGEKTKMTEIGEVPESWEVIKFENCIQKIKTGKAKQIPLKEYKLSGTYPIVDQGQSDIAGYTDNKEKVIFDNLPFIVFGDHTRIVKFVDFSFSLGADGTKLIKPNPSEFLDIFFYYQMLALDIPSRGYNRHYSVLKEKKMVKPNIPEQKKIALTLLAIDKKIESSQEKLFAYQNLFKTLLHELMSGERKIK
jgi:type I restriction enzyme S subunit